MAVIEKVSKQTQSAYHKCRAKGHPWDDTSKHSDYHYQGAKEYDYQVQDECPRCGMVVVLLINAWGDVVHRRYFPPTGYAWSSDDGSELPTRAYFRLLMLKEA